MSTKKNKNLFLVNKATYHNDNSYYIPLKTSSCFDTFVNNPTNAITPISNRNNHDMLIFSMISNQHNSLSTLNQTKKLFQSRRNLSQDNKRCQKIIDSQSNTMMSKQLLKNKDAIMQYNEKKVLFNNKSNELITMINKPLVRTRNNNNDLDLDYQQLNTINNDLKKKNVCLLSKYIYGVNQHENYFGSKREMENIQKSSSLQKIDYMKRKLNKEVISFSPSHNIPMKFDRISELFKPSYMRSFQNRIHDLNKFQIFIDYNKRKIDDEKIAQSTSNTMTILTNLNNKVQKNIENEDEDIIIDELI